MSKKLNLEAFYPDPPENVWRALTDPEALGRWLLPTNFQARLGFRFRFESGKAVISGEVLEVSEARRLAYTWDDEDGDAPGVVCWNLTPKDGGTLVTLEHMVLEAPKPYVLIESAANWSHAVGMSLPMVLTLMRAEARHPKAPIVYVEEEPEPESVAKRRAGFRQEEAICR